MTDNNNIAILLERIAIALETKAQPATSEGFFNYGRKIFCNITKGNGDGWYTLTDGVAITQPPLFRGRLISASFPNVERRGQTVRKFHLVMQAGAETITFESGYDCFFSKTVLSALATSSPEVLSGEIQMASYSKKLRTSDKTLAVSLRANGQLLAAEWTNDLDWSEIAHAAMANVQEVLKLRS